MNINLAELYRQMGQAPQNFNKRLQRGIFSKKMAKIAEVLNVGYEQVIALENRERAEGQLEKGRRKVQRYKKLQAFVSLTYIDVILERKNAVEAILKCGRHIQIGVELFAADR